MPQSFFQEEFIFTNPDGSKFHVIGSGNQHHAVFETLDGYTVIKNPANGYYEYADLSADKTDLVPSGVRVGASLLESHQLTRHLRSRAEVRKNKAMIAMKQLGGQPRWKIRREHHRNSTVLAAPAASRLANIGTTGNYVGLCLLIQFPDVVGTIGQEEVNNFCNQQGYSNYENNGSVYDYFYDNSDGKLHYTNVVTAYYTAQHERSYYTDNSVSYGRRAQELIIEGLDWLKSQGFDFSQLSSDSEGHIYALNVFYAGDRVNNWREGLWPHSSALANLYEVLPGKRFSDYQITNMGSKLALRTFCHENGHMICDFPDLYDYGDQSFGVGHYCLMCFGGSNNNPTQVCAYLKHKAGWTSRLTQIVGCMTAGITAGKNDFYLYPNPENAAEYFIIENRQQIGRDAALPDSGLAIWHVDESGSNNNEQMAPWQHYECSLEQADGRNDLEHRINPGDETDLYKAILYTKFDGTTLPKSTWWDGTNSGLVMSEISDTGSLMTFSTAGEDQEQGSIVGTWHSIGVDWDCSGHVFTVGPFTFCADGSWTYAYGGGRWLQVGNMVTWNFDNTPGLIYTANVNVNAMNGIMGYAIAGLNLKGCFYAIRQPLAMERIAAHSILGDVATGPV